MNGRALVIGEALIDIVESDGRVLGEHVGEIFGPALRLKMSHDLLDLGVRDEGSVHARDASAARHEQHVALAEQLFGALLAQDGAAVDLRRHLEGDAGREVRLDGTGDDVDRRALRGEHDVNAGGARHLRQTRDGIFDFMAGGHHEIGEFIDNDHDVRHAREQAHEWLRRVGLLEKANAYARTLSTGQRKRLELARALATQPRILLADESLGGLDHT